MFKLVTLLTIVACASAQSAAKYPAGVDPNKCPNFPICDNAVLHNQAPANNHWNAQYQAPAPAPQQWNQWNSQPAPQQQWQQPQQQWNAAPAQQWQQPQQQWQQPQQQWNAAPAPAPTSGGDKYPSGVNPQSCPNYPYCDVNAGLAGHNQHQVAQRAAPLAGFTERLYPAGVSPAQCPNYPEC